MQVDDEHLTLTDQKDQVEQILNGSFQTLINYCMSNLRLQMQLLYFPCLALGDKVYLQITAVLFLKPYIQTM